MSIIDIHLHTAEYSSCSRMSLTVLLQRAREIGLDGVCITDHESRGWASQAQEFSSIYCMTVLVGVELLTYEGDLLVFGLDSLPSRMLHAGALISHVNSIGGVCIAAHPFRDNNRGMGQFESSLRLAHGIEVLNGNTTAQDNSKAGDIAAKLALPQLGGSDSHDVKQIGKFATRFPQPITSISDFIKAVRQGDTTPVQYQNGIFKGLSDSNSVFPMLP